MTATRLGVDDRVWRDLEEVVQREILKRPQHILPRLDFLPAARRDVFVVQQQEPESGIGIRIGGDSGDDEVVEGGVIAGVVRDVQEFGPGVEGRGAGVARNKVVAVVGPVADVGAAGLGGDVARGGVYRAFVEGFDCPFDSQVDYASVKGVVSGWDDDPVLIGVMYPDADRVLASCGMPLAKLAAESKTPPMKAGMEGMTVGRSRYGYQSLLSQSRELAANPHWYYFMYLSMLRAFGG